MKNFFRALFALPLIASVYVLSAGNVRAQGYTLPANSAVQGHIISSQATPPTGVGCTVAAGSTDLVGHCTATAASGSITFTGGNPSGVTGFATAPTCLITDQSATSTVSMPVYTVSTTAITLSTIISTHVINWLCVPPNGG